MGFFKREGLPGVFPYASYAWQLDRQENSNSNTVSSIEEKKWEEDEMKSRELFS